MRSVDVPDISYDDDDVPDNHAMKARTQPLLHKTFLPYYSKSHVHRHRSKSKNIVMSSLNPTCPERASQYCLIRKHWLCSASSQ